MMKTVSTVKAQHEGSGSYEVIKRHFVSFQIEQVMYQAQLPEGGEFQSILRNKSHHMNLLKQKFGFIKRVDKG